LQAEEAQSNAVSEINTFMSSIWTCFQRWIWNGSSVKNDFQ
jgi:hypothetical protein